MKRLIFLILISFACSTSYSQPEQILATDSLNNFLKYNDSILAKINRYSSDFHKLLNIEGNDTLPKLIMNFSNQIKNIQNEYIALEIDNQFSPVKESFISVLRSIADYNELHLSKTEEYYNKWLFAIKTNDKKEKDKANDEICMFFNNLDKNKETFIKNYNNEIENLRNLLKTMSK
ncbi:MAG: hypothetical protein IT243_08635 [Bacteroidia bacterium]|nr:hypothetical protein [Bacteroidia bacterium]